MPYEAIQFDVENHVATVTLNRPDKLNSFNEQMYEELREAWRIVRSDDDIHVAVIRAAGDRSFCTGIDIAEGRWWADMNVWNQRDPGELLAPKSRGVWKPIVCAIQGMCAGGGMYFLNESDIVICSENATFFDPHANGGVVSAIEAIGMLHRNVPMGDVLRWALMGTEERITATTALRLGIVSEVVAADELWARADDIATQIAERDPIAIQGSVKAIWESLEMSPSMAKQNGMGYTHIGNAAAYARRVAEGGDHRVNRKPVFR